MSAYEIMLSESQERMLVVARRGREQEAQAIFTSGGRCGRHRQSH